MNSSRDRHIPPYRPIGKRNRNLPAPAATVEVVTRGGVPTLPPIDFGAFLTALRDVKPSDQLGFFARWVEKHQLRRDAARMQTYRVFVDEIEALLKKAADTEITQRTLLFKTEAAVRIAEKRVILEETLVDAEIAEAQKRIRRANNQDSDDD